MTFSKKLTMMILDNVLTAAIILLNSVLKLNLSETMQLALVGKSAAAIVTYMAAQGLIDLKKEKASETPDTTDTPTAPTA